MEDDLNKLVAQALVTVALSTATLTVCVAMLMTQ
jgi:hypothetical protein